MPDQPETAGPVVVVEIFRNPCAVAILAVALLKPRADKARQLLAEAAIELPEEGQRLGIDFTGKGRG